MALEFCLFSLLTRGGVLIIQRLWIGGYGYDPSS